MKIGIIGLDTSHVMAFTSMLNDKSHPHHIPGGRVIAAYPGGSPDMALSLTRLNRYTEQLQADFGVKIFHSMEEVVQQVDAILLESVDGRVHLNQFRQIAPYQKPVFIDKPLAASAEDAVKIMHLARKHQTPLMSSSALRYSESFAEALTSQRNITGIDLYGTPELETTQPGIFWYGIHMVEMLYAALGPGCKKVHAAVTDHHEIITAQWDSGTFGTIRGNRVGNYEFGCVLHSPTKSIQINASSHRTPYYGSLLKQIMHFFETHECPIDGNETLEIMYFIEAANQSRLTGETVELIGKGIKGIP